MYKETPKEHEQTKTKEQRDKQRIVMENKQELLQIAEMKKDPVGYNKLLMEQDLIKEKLSNVVNPDQYNPKSMNKISKLLNNLVHFEIKGVQQTKEKIAEVATEMILLKISLPQELQSEKKKTELQKQNILLLQNKIRSMQTQIKSMVKTPELEKQIQQKVSVFEVKRKKIKQENKVQIKYGKQPNQLLIFCQNLYAKKIQTFIDSLFQNRKNVQVTFEKVIKKLRGGAEGQPEGKIHIKVNIENLIAQLLDQSKKIQQILITNSSVKKQFLDILFDYIKQIQQKSNEIKQLSKQLTILANNQKDKLAFQKNKDIDVVIVMDTTRSMKNYLQQAKCDSINIMKMFKQRYPKTSLQFGFVSYKDHCDNPVLRTYDLNEDVAYIQKQIKVQKAYGGGDIPQAVHDGLYAASNLSWRENSQKFVILIADAPPHGKQYWAGDDDYPKGCQCGITIDSIASIYKKKKINLTLKGIGSFLKKTNSIFENEFQKGYYQFGEIKQAADYASSSVDYLQQKMKVIREKSKILEESLAKLAHQLVQKVKEQAKIVIEQSQKMREVEQIEQNRNELTRYFESIKEIESQSKQIAASTLQLNKTIFCINAALKLKAKIEEVKNIKEKIKMMKKPSADFSQIKILLSSEIKRWRVKGFSNSKIINNLIDAYEVDEYMAQLLIAE